MMGYRLDVSLRCVEAAIRGTSIAIVERQKEGIETRVAHDRGYFKDQRLMKLQLKR